MTVELSCSLPLDIGRSQHQLRADNIDFVLFDELLEGIGSPTTLLLLAFAALRRLLLERIYIILHLEESAV